MAEPHLALGVLSTASRPDRRALIRATWGREAPRHGVLLRFVLGGATPPLTAEHASHRDLFFADGVLFVAQSRNGVSATLIRVPFNILQDFGSITPGGVTLRSMEEWTAVRTERVTGAHAVKVVLALAGLWACRAQACGFPNDPAFRTPRWYGLTTANAATSLLEDA